MALLDFLTKAQGLTASPQEQTMVSPFGAGLDAPQGDGLLSAMGPQMMQQGPAETMTRMPQISPGPSLLDGIKDGFGKMKDPGSDGISFLDRIYAAADEYDTGNGMAHLQGKRKEHQSTLDKAAAGQALARKNAAFRGAYRDGRFDPQAYMDALGAEDDASDAFSFAKAAAPQGGVDGATAWTRDPFSGETTWGEQRQESPAERERAAQNDEMMAYRQEMMELRRQQEERARRQGDERIGLSRQREGRVAAGGGGRGGVPPLPPGFMVEK